jgi:anti-sigma B factor antagonist
VPLQGTYRDAGDVAVVDFSGKITLGEGSATLRRMVKDLVDTGHRKILLNLYDVDYIDSSGIGELVAAYTTVRGASGELKIVHLTKRVHDILQITRLFTIFDVQSDEATALRSFGGTASAT